MKNEPSLFLQQVYSQNSSNSCASRNVPSRIMHCEDGNCMTITVAPEGIQNANRLVWAVPLSGVIETPWGGGGGPRALGPSPTTVLASEREPF